MSESPSTLSQTDPPQTITYTVTPTVFRFTPEGGTRVRHYVTSTYTGSDNQKVEPPFKVQGNPVQFSVTSAALTLLGAVIMPPASSDNTNWISASNNAVTIEPPSSTPVTTDVLLIFYDSTNKVIYSDSDPQIQNDGG